MEFRPKKHTLRTPVFLLACLVCALSCAPSTWADSGSIPGLVDISRLEPTIKLDIRYATPNNFTGQVVYPAPRCLLREDVAEKLIRVHRRLTQLGYGLKIYDGYRPLAVQKRFWVILPVEDYVADPFKGSRHNRGAAVDVGLVDAEGREVPMPTGYDDFTEKAHRDYMGASEEALRNRALLEEAMKSEGFIPFPSEWWHFDAPGWQDYPVSDRPLWAWSEDIVRIVSGTRQATELAGFYMAQDYSLYGDLLCRFILPEEPGKAIAALMDGEADLAVVPSDLLPKNMNVPPDLAVLAVLHPDVAGKSANGIILARKDRFTADRDRLVSLVRSTAGGLALAERYFDAAAMAVLRRNPGMSFEECRRSLVELAAKRGANPPAGIGQETWTKVFGPDLPFPAVDTSNPEAPDSLPIRYLHPVTLAAPGGLLPLAGALTEGADRVLDSELLVVETGGSETSARLVGLGLSDFGLAAADVVAEMEAGTGRFAGEPHPVRLVATLFVNKDEPPVSFIASREVPAPWIDGLNSILKARGQI